MTAVIYARYSSDSQREESIAKARSGNAPPMRKRMASRWSNTILTGQSLQKRTTARSSNR